MSNEQAGLKWGHYPVLHEDNIPELEAAAAAHEFRNGLRRPEAEGRAHADYVRARAVEAAAHHLLGMRSAHAVGADESAAKHGAGYAAAMDAAGHNAFGEVPQEVLDRVHEMAPKAHSFKAHAADAMFAPAVSDNDPDGQRLQLAMQKLRAVNERAQKAAETAKP